MWGWQHSVLTPLCPPIGLCYFLSFNLSILFHFKPFFTTPSFLPFSSHSGPLPHAGVLSLLVHPCKTAHANTVTHTPLRLYLIIGSITGDIFPDNGIEGSEPGEAEWRGDLSIPHHMEAIVLALPVTEMNEFNISPFWSTDDLLMQLRLSHGRSSSFFSVFALWYVKMHAKMSAGIQTETNLFFGLTRLMYIFVHVPLHPL